MNILFFENNDIILSSVLFYFGIAFKKFLQNAKYPERTSASNRTDFI